MPSLTDLRIQYILNVQMYWTELPKLNEAGEKYDVVILDPPAFTKSREATKERN